MGVLAFRVEEEFLLLGPDGAVVPSAPFVSRLTRAEDNIRAAFLAYQLATATPWCGGLDELRDDLSGLRRLAADAARRAGACLVPAGVPPFAAGPLAAVTDETRYRAIAGRFPEAVPGGATCACRVFVEVPSRDLAVEVLARIRPWLPALLALSVNSPYAGGRDTGWASYRHYLQQRWPTFQPPGAWRGAAAYDEVVQSLIDSGSALDEAGVYFLARLAPGEPATVEVRVADTGLTVDDTVFFAEVVRGLVTGLISDARRNLSSAPIPTDLVDQQLTTAAHGELRVHGGTGAVARLMRQAGRYTDDAGAGWERLRRLGTGAARQRRAWVRYGTVEGFIGFLANCAVPRRAGVFL
ncbi:carboxylate-amine ligase [Paractinoplanes rishiriensis]|uniref:Glutamate--cysteine ligase 2 n=1 Tax=Paractinoplanes rishiriensis TaxID=1050105 RepID=A0A919MX39_9ACTN|nr:glutamate-cysteine ligase family protein [Actinoplanes rishiriensis]GIE98498.1 putative glutamate--cysteine ligase 2 [Actinoplanes rishiriensis]